MGLHLKWVIAFCLAISFTSVDKVYAITSNKPEQLKFKKTNLELTFKDNKKIIRVELAETQEQHAEGLMFRKKLKNNEGMLFVFKNEQVREFWMKNTVINLDIGYFNKNRKLIDIQQMAAITSVLQIDIPTYPSKQPAMYALEMAQGWFKNNKFEEGTDLKMISRPLSE